MPQWMRISIVALLAGVSTGCGTNGLYWLDDKFSRLSTPPSNSVGPKVASTNAAIREGGVSPGPGRIAAKTGAWPTPEKDPNDGVIDAPSRFKVVSNVRTVDADPPAPKSVARNDDRIPAAFALATPKGARGSRIPNFETDAAATLERNELTSSNATIDSPDALVSLVAGRRNHDVDGELEEDGSAAEVPPREMTKRTEAGPADNDRRIAVTPKRTAVEADLPRRSQPIPKATPLPAPPKTLKLVNVALCSAIDGFGKYTPMKAPLAPGGEAIVYVEVSGRTAKRVANGVETRLRSKLRLTPKAGGPTTEWVKPEIVSDAPAERSEFFCHLLLKLPESASEGEYRLEVVVEDVHGGAAVSGETSLRVESSTASTN
jgi:hypothetical protein